MVVDPSSEQKMVNYQRLLADANELFDLWWLNEELTKLLFSSKQKMAFTDFVRWHQSWEENADLYFASSYLLSYREVLREMTAIVDEEMPYEYYEDQLKTTLWSFVATASGKAWRPTKQSEEAVNRTKRWKISAKHIFSLHKLDKDADVKEFFTLLHRLAIVNDVLRGRGKRHGIEYSKHKTDEEKDPVTAFCNQVMRIMDAFAEKNGTIIQTNAKGVAGQYTFQVDADTFRMVMNELRMEHDYCVSEYLQGRDVEGAKQLSLVCPFIGHALSLNIINTKLLQNIDLEPMLQQFYPGKKSIIAKLSFRSGTNEEKKLFRLVEILLKPYRKE